MILPPMPVGIDRRVFFAPGQPRHRELAAEAAEDRRDLPEIPLPVAVGQEPPLREISELLLRHPRQHQPVRRAVLPCRRARVAAEHIDILPLAQHRAAEDQGALLRNLRAGHLGLRDTPSRRRGVGVCDLGEPAIHQLETKGRAAVDRHHALHEEVQPARSPNAVAQPEVTARGALLRRDEGRRLAVGSRAVEELRRIGSVLQSDRVVDHARVHSLAILDLAHQRVAEQPERGVPLEWNRIIAIRANPARLPLKQRIPLRRSLAPGLRTHLSVRARQPPERRHRSADMPVRISPNQTHPPVKPSPNSCGQNVHAQAGGRPIPDRSCAWLLPTLVILTGQAHSWELI